MSSVRVTDRTKSLLDVILVSHAQPFTISGNFKGGPTRGVLLQEYVAAKCSRDKIALSTHWADMLQGCVAGTCSKEQIVDFAHLWKCYRDVFQGHVTATRTLVCAGTFSLAQHEICAKFVPTTCCTEFNLLNFVGHVAATEFFVRRHDHRVHDCAACPCSKTNIWANQRQNPSCFTVVH